ncbi:PTS sugar transporter subunit IIA [Aerococcus kribbianus]|uniref:PTS glucose transporter subunit IIA n=1 Tax=Aerococcus kribbianus TaxID=2999064 RepID=A0A9X3FLZ3_9LACT|nr:MULTISPECIES: PTS glucose transporter subunit IIA [unclassified Aerococcus]MCZ0716982.1 PTS glucose transporter subunit IIA [Aerococcus sp. YH-aer221]MCZ0725270.1 PTS glucose transporter subunit IIA [Aerococcus sp. YH-aer222]
MFDFLKRKKNDNDKKELETVSQDIFAVADGDFVAIDAIDDPVFSQKMMGDGYGITPDNGEIYAPVKGTVMSIFQTKHAVYIKTDSDLEVLVHMGIDTVELEGGPFTIAVEEGQKVDKGSKIADVDLAALESAGKENTMVVIFTNMNEVVDFEITGQGHVSAGDVLGQVSASQEQA